VQAAEHSKGSLRGPTRNLEIDVTLVEAVGYRPPPLGALPESRSVALTDFVVSFEKRTS
jgi:hypothetical protein